MKNKKMYNLLPNAISFLRIVCSIALLIVEPLSMSFIGLYLLCGISDIMDGFVARKLKMESNAGALLDSISDIIFTIILMVIFLPILDWKNWIVCWIVAITGIRILSLIIGACKFHTFATIHTYGNKVTGLALFLFPMLLKIAGIGVTAFLLCFIATLSAIEEMMIMISLKYLDRDKKHIFYFKL